MTSFELTSLTATGRVEQREFTVNSTIDDSLTNSSDLIVSIAAQLPGVQVVVGPVRIVHPSHPPETPPMLPPPQQHPLGPSEPSMSSRFFVPPIPLLAPSGVPTHPAVPPLIPTRSASEQSSSALADTRVKDESWTMISLALSAAVTLGGCICCCCFYPRFKRWRKERRLFTIRIRPVARSRMIKHATPTGAIILRGVDSLNPPLTSSEALIQVGRRKPVSKIRHSR